MHCSHLSFASALSGTAWVVPSCVVLNVARNVCSPNAQTYVSAPGYIQEELKAITSTKPQKRQPERPRTDYQQVGDQRFELPDISEGTTETICLLDSSKRSGNAISDGSGREPTVFLDRRDVWAAPGWDKDPMVFRRS